MLESLSGDLEVPMVQCPCCNTTPVQRVSILSGVWHNKPHTPSESICTSASALYTPQLLLKYLLHIRAAGAQ
jgi:hypothetical protein